MKAGFVMLTTRVPATLVDKLDQLARASYRSRTGELVQRLEASMDGQWVNEHGAIVSTTRAGKSDQQRGGHQ